jgi:hypothetical protein
MIDALLLQRTSGAKTRRGNKRLQTGKDSTRRVK